MPDQRDPEQFLLDELIKQFLEGSLARDMAFQTGRDILSYDTLPMPGDKPPKGEAL